MHYEPDKPVIELDDIEILRLVVTPETSSQIVDYVYKFFNSKDIWPSLTDKEQTGSFMTGFTNDVLSGQISCYVPTVDDTPMGMFYFRWLNSRILECSQGIYFAHGLHSGEQPGIYISSKTVRMDRGRKN